MRIRLCLAILLAAPLLAWASDDPRVELRGRVVDAATGEPLAGAVVVAAWSVEQINPAALALALAVPVGHPPGGVSQRRLGYVVEAQSAADGTFVFPAWKHEDQINGGMIVSRTVKAFLPGYEPSEGINYFPPKSVEVLKLRLGSTLAGVKSFRAWLADNVARADGEWLEDSDGTVRVTPGEMREESYNARLARTAQATAIRMVREEFARLEPRPPDPNQGYVQSVLEPPSKAPPMRIVVTTNRVQAVRVSPASAPAVPFPPATPPELDAERAFRSGDRRHIVLDACWGGREIMPGWPSEEAHGYYTARTSGRVISCGQYGPVEAASTRALNYAAAYNRALLEMAAKTR